MSKKWNAGRETIAVYTAEGFARFVTPRQTAGEVAGKVLAKRVGFDRLAERVTRMGSVVWQAFYRKVVS